MERRQPSTWASCQVEGVQRGQQQNVWIKIDLITLCLLFQTRFLKQELELGTWSTQLISVNPSHTKEA